MKHLSVLKRSALCGGAFVVIVTTAGGAANALNYGAPVPQNDGTSTAVSNVINRGDQEITRRLTTLNTLAGKINATTKLSASDKTYLLNEVNGEISNLTALKAKLDADTTLADAHADAQSIVSSYRVYALIVPKVRLLTVADGQQIVESKLSQLAAKLQTRLTNAKNAGKNVSSLATTLADMQTQTANASTISASVEQKVMPLQPTDYNNDHSILDGYRAQLQTAHNDNLAATSDAKTIVAGLKAL